MNANPATAKRTVRHSNKGNHIARTRGERIGNTIILILLTLLSLIMIYPFWHVLMYSISDAKLALGGGIFLWPRGFSLYGYKLSRRTRRSGLPIATPSSRLRRAPR